MSTPVPGEVIAERELQVDGGAGRAVVRIGKPAPDPREGDDWSRPFQIIGLETKPFAKRSASLPCRRSSSACR